MVAGGVKHKQSGFESPHRPS